MKLNPNMAARENADGTQPGRAGSPLHAAEGDKVSALAASSRRRARSDAPHQRLVSLRSLRSLAVIVVGLLLAGAAAPAQVNSGSNG